MRKPIAKDGNASRAPLSPTAFLFDGAMTDAVSRAGMAWAKACVDWQQELARFASSRIESDIECAKSIAQCESIIDLAKLQRKWTEATVNDYASEAGELLQIVHRAARDGYAARNSA